MAERNLTFSPLGVKRFGMEEKMDLMDISFPNLGIYLKNVPKSFSIFGFEIALYGVIIGLGVIGGILIAAWQAKRSGQDPELYWDFSIYAVILSIIGARIYYVIFAWDQYKNNLINIFNIRQGGLAIYGGVITAFITLFVYAKIKKQNAFRMADTGVTGLILGQAIGRWGNFTNREVFGEYTNNLLAMRLPVAAVRPGDISQSLAEHMEEGMNYIQVHPTFLYESLWNLGVLALILLYWKHKKFEGEIALLYLGGYGLGRAWIEGIRTDQLFIPGTEVPVSQVLAIVLFVGAVACDIVVRLRIKNNGEK